jgi:hypothetical protein
MFASDLELGELQTDAAAARRQWAAAALERGDKRLAAIVAALDAATFESTWAALCRALQRRGRRAMLAWVHRD